MMKTWIATLLCLAAATAGAQNTTVWRCGADGRSYSDTPCPQGRELAVAQAPRPAEDVAQAHEAARREQARAEKLTQERRQREAQGVNTAAAGIHGARPAADAPLKAAEKPRSAKHRPKRPTPEDDGIWRATAPSSRHTKG